MYFIIVYLNFDILAIYFSVNLFPLCLSKIHITEFRGVKQSIVDVVMSLQILNNEDREHILTTINALVRDVKARNTYA